MSATTLDAPRPMKRTGALRGLAWVTWRQHRVALIGSVLFLGAISLYLVVSGLAMHHAYVGYGLNKCDIRGSACPPGLLNQFQQQYQGPIHTVTTPLLLVPVILGVFLGAPVVARELESGTYRFAWTQGRNRVRWVIAKLVILGTILTVLALGFSALYSWWYGPFNAINGRISPGGAYEISGIVLAARTLFAFSLGALLGAIIRRTVPAMAATAALSLSVVITSTIWLRQHIEKPVTLLIGGNGLVNSNVSMSIQLDNGNNAQVGAQGPQTSWQLSNWTQNAAGHHLTSSQTYALLQQAQAGPFAPNAPPFGQGATTVGPGAGPAPSGGDFPAWLAQHGYKLGATFQPNSRFWHFQSVEAAAYVLLSLLCAAGVVWWIRRRTA
jgi:hypothetical protein